VAYHPPTAPEASALVSACRGVTAALVESALATGARRGDLLGLRWRDVDFQRRDILFRAATSKARRDRVVPMTDRLHAVLVQLKASRPRPAMDGTDLVYVKRDGTAVHRETLRQDLRVALLRAGDGIPLEKRDAVTFHTLRHTAASLMVAAGVPLFDVAKILGHSTLAVTMRYAHFAPEAGRAAVEKLGAALAGTTAERQAKAGA
jgi:integrase